MNIHQLIDDHIETVLSHDCTYDLVQRIKEQKTKILEFQRHAQDFSIPVRTKAQVRYEKTLEAERHQKAGVYTGAFTGDRIDMLVRKFAFKLLQRVRENRNRDLQKDHSKLVHSLINQIARKDKPLKPEKATNN